MDESDGLRGFFEPLKAAAESARAALIEQTIDTYGPRVRDRLARVRESNPGMSDDALADQLIRDAASHAGSIGAAVALPGLIPGPGTAVSVALAAPEIAWLFREQVKLVLEIAALYGHDPTDRDARSLDMDGLFDRAFAAVHTGNTGTQALITTLMRAGWRRRAAALSLLVASAAGVGFALRRGRLLRRLPLLGIPIGAAANAFAVMTVGSEARQRYRSQEASIEPAPPASTEPPPWGADEGPAPAAEEPPL
jgi:hypothetical protein